MVFLVRVSITRGGKGNERRRNTIRTLWRDPIGRQDWWFLNNREKPAKRSVQRCTPGGHNTRCGFSLLDTRHFLCPRLSSPGVWTPFISSSCSRACLLRFVFAVSVNDMVVVFTEEWFEKRCPLTIPMRQKLKNSDAEYQDALSCSLTNVHERYHLLVLNSLSKLRISPAINSTPRH